MKISRIKIDMIMFNLMGMGWYACMWLQKVFFLENRLTNDYIGFRTTIWIFIQLDMIFQNSYTKSGRIEFKG